MALKSSNCPNCGGAYNPTENICDYCGSYIIVSNANFVDLSNTEIKIKKVRDDKYPGIYVFGRLLGKGEKPIAMGAANYFNGIASAGGKLLLTNSSLLFSAHAFNVGKKAVCIELNDIVDVKVSANLLISQHITVLTNEGSHKFVVYHGKEWVERIKEAKKHINEIESDDAESSESAPAPARVNEDYTVELRKLKSLLDDGIITQKEYDIKKRNILGI